MIFSGSTRRPRQVNLGSRTPQKSKDQLLAQAQQERIKRQQDKLQASAAARIQKQFKRKAQLKANSLAVVQKYLQNHSLFTESSYLVDFVLASLCLRVSSCDIQHVFLEALVKALQSEAPLKHFGVVLASSIAWPEKMSESCFSLALKALYLLLDKHKADISLFQLVRFMLDHLNDTHTDIINTMVAELVKSKPKETLAVLLKYPGIINVLSQETVRPLALASLSSQAVSPDAFEAIALLIEKLGPITRQNAATISRLVAVLYNSPHPHKVASLESTTLSYILDSSASSAVDVAKLVLMVEREQPELVVEVLAKRVSFERGPSSLWDFLWEALPKNLCDVDPFDWSQDDTVLFGLILRVFWTKTIVQTDWHILRLLAAQDRGTLNEYASLLRKRTWCTILSRVPDQRLAIPPKLLYFCTNYVYRMDMRQKLLPKNFWVVQEDLQSQSILENALPSDLQVRESYDSYQPSDQEHDSDEMVVDDEDEAPSTTFARLMRYAPFLVDFHSRASVFQKFKDNSRSSFRHVPPKHSLVSRDNIVEDMRELFEKLSPEEIKNHLQVMFVDRHGMEEQGVDGGGLTKEALSVLSDKVFKSGEVGAELHGEFQPFFIQTSDHELYPNPGFGSEMRQWFRFFGLIVGKCLHEGVLLDVSFSRFFLQLWIGSSPSFADLYSLDRELYDNMAKLSMYSNEHLQSLELYMTAPHSAEIELVEGGDEKRVTRANLVLYHHLVARHLLLRNAWDAYAAFVTGVQSMIPKAWLQMFDGNELSILLSGESRDFDIEDLRRYTEVTGFAHDSESIENFWSVLGEFTTEQRGLFLKFVTSVPRAPLLGFRKLQPRFGLRGVGKHDQRLPTASTCFNLLKIPDYSSLELLREKLLYAIEQDAGFYLS